MLGGDGNDTLIAGPGDSVRVSKGTTTVGGGAGSTTSSVAQAPTT